MAITLTTRIARTQFGLALIATFEVEKGVTNPEEAAAFAKANSGKLVPPEGHGLVVDGRGPVWLFGMLLHEGHPSSWAAVRDPRLGFVVTSTHTEGVAVGTVAEFPAEQSA